MAIRARESFVYHDAPVPVKLGRTADAEPDPWMSAKLVANGRSQAVRLPKEISLPGVEILIRRDGNRVILVPVKDVPRDANGWPVDLWEWLDQFSDDFSEPEPIAVGLLGPESIPSFDALMPSPLLPPPRVSPALAAPTRTAGRRVRQASPKRRAL